MGRQLKRLAEPIKIGTIEAKNRIWFSPVWTRFATVNGEVTQTLIDHYTARARGGAGLITQEATAVDSRHVWNEPEIRISESMYAPGLHKIVESVHRYDVPIICQLHCSGMFGTDPISPSGVPAYDFGLSRYMQPRTLSVAEIEEIRDLFIAAAVRAKVIGYDGVELHGATAYLLEQFLSPHNNKRTDKYGGSLENRILLALEIVRGMRDQCGPDYVLGYTSVDDDALPDGIRSEETLIFAQELEKAGLTYFDLQIPGTYETFHYGEIAGLVRKQKRGMFDVAKKYKKVLNIPVTCRSCSNTNYADWENSIAKGEIDAVRTGRPLVADPDLPKKVLEGRLQDIRRCLVCNECLQTGVFDIWACNCTVNYGFGRGEVTNIKGPAGAVPKKVLVVGGGPGGLEAARVAANRGHNVTLMEKQPKLGGEVRIAALSLDKKSLMGLILWQERECKKRGVTIELNKKVTPKVVEKFNPDVAIIATGAIPNRPPIPGINKSHVVTADVVFEGKASLGKKVVVAGGEMVGVEVADFIIQKGLAKDVTIIDPGPMEQIGKGMPGIDLAYWMRNVFPTLGLKIVTDMQVDKISDKELVAIDKRWRRHSFEADTVVLALGYTPVRDLADALKGKVPELYIIGDAREPRNMMNAVHDGAYFGQLI
jgi:2,4-dienoyl-CoA reductase-like NADH-dependent reductase (Old Yellow Enzyme family)/thioredoxin reductase